jgi:D,D-heptose 1,7-bisphosphate phosphatase
MNKAAFLDRDGTVNIDFGYVHDIKNWKFIENAIEAISILNKNGYVVIVITNQSGVARGFYKEEDVVNLHLEVNKILAEYGAHIDKFYYCPHHIESKISKYRVDCDCRKPKSALFNKAIIENNIDISKSIACGDNDRDTQAAMRAGITKIGQIGINCTSLYDWVVNSVFVDQETS